MNANLYIDGSELWHVTGWTMVHFLWLGTLVAIAAAAIRPLFPRAATNGRYALAVSTLAMLGALPFGIAAWLIATSPVSLTVGLSSTGQSAPAAPIFEPAATGRLNYEIIELSGLEPVAVPTGMVPPAAGSAEGFPRDGMQETAFPSESVPENPRQSRGLAGVADGVTLSSFLIQSLNACVPYLPLVWFVGAPMTFALLATGVVGTRRLRRASRAIEDGPITEQLARLAASMRVGRRVSIAVCERIAAPVLVGILRPIILLPPAALTGWSPDEIEMVLLHELAHVRRWDNAVNLAQRIVESLLFFHPAVWIVSNWIRREREACCDAVVVGRTKRPHAYAELLVALAAQMPRSVLFHPAASSAMAAGPLRKRIRRILQLEDDPMLVSGKSFVMVLASLLVAATLAVLYLPSIGQAEESTAGSREATTEQKDLATEATESTEKNEDSQSETTPKSVGVDTPSNLGADDITNNESAPDTNESTASAKIGVVETEMVGGQRVIGTFTFDHYSDKFWEQLQAAVEQAKRDKLYVDMRLTDGQLSLVAAEPPTEERWPSMLGEPPRKDRVIAEKAWQRLGLKLVPSSALENLLFGARNVGGGVKIIGGNVPKGLPLPAFLRKIGSTEIHSFDNLNAWLSDGIKPDSVKVHAVADGHEYLIDSRAIGELEAAGHRAGDQTGAANEPSMGDPHSDLLLREIAELQSKKSAFEKQLYQLQRESVKVPQSELNQLEEGHQAQTIGSLQHQWGVINNSLEKLMKRLNERVQTSVEQERRNAELEQRRKFPSLEEQKLADLAFRKLGWELEAIGDEDLARVKALDYEGGVKVAYAPMPAGFTNISYGHIQTGDLLVGLHVWPTTSLKQVIDVLARDDLAELNPIKFYIVRRLLPGQQQGASGEGGGRAGGQGGRGGDLGPYLAQSIGERKSKDIIMTGRITVPVEKDAQPSQSRETTPTMRMPWDLGPRTVSPTSSESNTPQTPGGLKVYFFHSEASAPSREMKLLVERVTEVPPGAEFIEFDVDKKPELAKQMNIDRVPTCVFMRHGTELGRLDGVLTEHHLRDAIRTILSSNDSPSVPVATAPRLSDLNDRTARSAGRVVKTFDADTPAEDVKAAIETLAEAGAIGGPAQVEVVPHNGKTALVVRGPAASTRDVAPNRANFRYEGKTFDEWRDAWRTELSTEKRLEAVKALAAFGSAGSNVIKQSDVLMLNAVRIVPKSPHPIEPFDGLLIRVTDAPAGDPIADAFVVDPEGKVDLGQRYGKVSVRGMTTPEAQDAVHQHLVKRITGEDLLSDSNPMFVTVSLAFSAGSQQVVGEHVVGPDGKINLGTYGTVPVAGKTIDEARRAIESQLANYLEKPEVVVHMFATDSGRNYAQEAAEAIITVAGQYNWSKPASNESLILLREACKDAFGGHNDSLPAQLPPSEALSALLQAARSSAAPSREFAAIALQHYARQDQSALDAIVRLSRDEDAYVRKLAWSTLFHTYTPDLPAAFARVREALASDQPELHTGALKAISKYDQRRKLQQATSAAERHLPEIAVLLFSDVPEVRRHARQAVYGVSPEAASGIVQQLMDVLQGDSRSADHVHAIRALAALGLRAKPAVDLLTEILVADKNSLRIPAAAALTSVLGDFEFNKVLGDTIAAELKIDVSEDGTVSMRGRPDSQIFLDFSDALKAERRSLFP